MISIPLVGVFEGATGGNAARTVRCQIETRLGGERLLGEKWLDSRCVASVVNAIASAESDARLRGLIPHDARVGVDLVLASEESLVLREESFSLPIYVGIMAGLAGVAPISGVCCTGVVDESGSLHGVADLDSKLEEAGRQGARLIVPGNSPIPGAQVVASRQSVAHAWLGSPFFEKVGSLATCGESALEVWEDFLGGCCSENFTNEIDAMVLSLFERFPHFQDAFLVDRGRWALGCLRLAGAVAENRYAGICQLLDPRQAFSWIWQWPAERERFIEENLAALLSRSIDGPAEAVRAASALLRMVGNRVELSEVLRENARIRELALRLGAPASPKEVPQVSAARGQFSALVGAFLQAGSVDAVASDVFKDGSEETDLEIAVIYTEDTGDLSALEFSLPDHPEMAPSRLDHPAALFDFSPALPAAWQRLTRAPAESGIGSIPLARDILDRFGARNRITFPPLQAYGGRTVIRWGDTGGTWPPSIDTLHLVGLLRKLGYYDRKLHLPRVLDLGCGTGVHGILLARNASVGLTDFLDVEPGARVSTYVNVLVNFVEPGDRAAIAGAEFFSPEGLSLGEQQVRFINGGVAALDLGDEPYDLVICTPPYVPFLGVLGNPDMWKAVAGTDLLRFVLSTARSLSRKTIVQFSEIALPEVEDLLGEAELVGKHRVGFRIPPLGVYFDPKAGAERLSRGQAWLERVRDHLIDLNTDPGGVEAAQAHGFRYFHMVRTYVL